jgi:hypothetical protein
MMLIRLTYFSRNRLDGRNISKDVGIADILATSAANNLRDRITGVLICDDRWFAQVLEGAESNVSATFERILRDERHCNVTLVTMQPVAERRYPAFPMKGFVRSDDNDDLFRHYSEHESFDPREMRADRLSDLIEEVVRRGAKGEQSLAVASRTSVA